MISIRIMSDPLSQNKPECVWEMNVKEVTIDTDVIALDLPEEVKEHIGRSDKVWFIIRRDDWNTIPPGISRLYDRPDEPLSMRNAPQIPIEMRRNAKDK